MKTTIDKSRLFKRSWYLVKRFGYSFSFSLSKVWVEMKQTIIEKVKEAENEAKSVKLAQWWSTDEYKQIERNENNKFKQFAADRR